MLSIPRRNRLTLDEYGNEVDDNYADPSGIGTDVYAANDNAAYDTDYNVDYADADTGGGQATNYEDDESPSASAARRNKGRRQKGRYHSRKRTVKTESFEESYEFDK